MQLNTQQRYRTMAGYTLDQTILIVAVIAILVTIIVGSMGWELLSRAGGTKLASHLRQIETANGQFYAEYDMWPHEATNNSSGADNMIVLLGDTAKATELNLDAGEELKNYLPSYETDGSTVTHPFGSGGEITQEVETITGGTQSYLTLTLQSVPRAEAMEADESIDGKNPTPFAQGRVQVPTDDGTSSTVTLKYYANVVN
jgi:hypothetical protein